MQLGITPRLAGAGMIAFALVAASCGDPADRPGTVGEPAADVRGRHDVVRPRLLIAQAQFHEVLEPNGETVITPGPARLTIATRADAGWTTEIVEDADGNVFHKAVGFGASRSGSEIVTISGNAEPAPAYLKRWRRGLDRWEPEVLASMTFGHRHNRFRDVEIGDLVGDEELELAVATHDDGVVAVVRRGEDARWTVDVLDRSPATFVHEIELGDLDGDGRLEIYATPTAPNRMDRGRQPGKVIQYRRSGDGWNASPVAVFDDRHAKEIVVADMDGLGRPDLFAAVEPPADPAVGEVRRTTIVRYRLDGGDWRGQPVAEIPAPACRSLTVGDVDGDGRREMIAGCGRTGLWMLQPHGAEWRGGQSADA
ncbi:MAG: hypothetical protein AB1Z65_08055 [Candidatus Sulfomarinibacteraceae bacterium]